MHRPEIIASACVCVICAVTLYGTPFSVSIYILAAGALFNGCCSDNVDTCIGFLELRLFGGSR